MKTTRNIVMTDSEAQGLQSTAVGGKRIGEKYVNDPTTQARGVQSFAAGASCESDGEASISLGMGAKAYQRSSASIGKACRSGLTIAEFNDKYATDTQKATAGYDNTKINGGVSSLSIKDSHGDEYSTSYSSSFASGVETKSYGWGAFTSGLNNISAADGAATFGNNNTNKGINAFVTGANNEATVPKSFLFGEGLRRTKGDGPVFVIGKYNEDVEDYAFEVGAGSSDIERKNGFTINSSGRAYMNGAETESLPKSVSKAVINRTDLNTELLLKSDATNWKNGAGDSSAQLGFTAAIGANSTYGVVTGKSNTVGIDLKKTLACGIVGGTGNLLLGGADDASQDNSIILGGTGNQSAHSNCLISGSYNITADDGQTIFGQYAVQDTNALFQVGCGTSTNREDAITVNKNGTVYINDLIPKTSSVNLGSTDHMWSTVFARNIGGGPYSVEKVFANNLGSKEYPIGNLYLGTITPYSNNEINFNILTDTNGLVFGSKNSTKEIKSYEFQNGTSGEKSDFSWIKSKGFIPYKNNLINFNLNSDNSFIAFGYNGSEKPINNYVFYNGQTDSSITAVKSTLDCKGLKTHTWGTGGEANLDLKNTSSSSIPYSIGASDILLGNYTLEAYSKGTVVGSSEVDNGDCALYSVSTSVARFFFRNNGSWGEVPVKQAIQATYAGADTTKGTIDNRLNTLNTRLDSLGFKQGDVTNIIGSISNITLKKLGKYVICSFTANGSFSFTLPEDFKPSSDIQSSVGGAIYVTSAREYQGGGGNITVSSTDGNVACTVQGPMPSGRPVSLGWSTSSNF